MKSILAFCLVFVLSIAASESHSLATYASHVDPTGETISKEVRFLGEGIAASRNRLRSGQAKIYTNTNETIENAKFNRLTQNGGKTPLEAKQTQSFAEWNLALPDMSLLFRPDSVPRKEVDVIKEVRVVIRKKKVTMLQTYFNPLRDETEEPGLSYHAVIRSPEVAAPDGISQDLHDFDPRVYAYFSGELPLDKILLDPKAKVAYLDTIPYFGSRCMRVKYQATKQAYVLFTIDIEHGFILRSTDVFADMGGKYFQAMKITVPEIVSDNDIWLPGSVIQETFVPAMIFPEHGSDADKYHRVLLTRKTIRINDFKANRKVPDEAFDIELPAETEINDHIDEQHSADAPALKPKPQDK